MNAKFKQLLESIVPFLLIGIAIALVLGFFIMLSYVFFWGLVIGGVLWLGYFIKNLLLPSKPSDKMPKKSEGRIIEHDDED